jgi:hypothetical protein
MRVHLSTMMCLVASLAGVTRAEHFQADDPAYIAPLVGPYAVEAYPASGHYHSSSCALVIPNYDVDEDPIREILPAIRQIAVSGPVIAGEAGTGWFVFDTRQSTDFIQHFDSMEAWRAALAAAGVGQVKIQSADEYAASLPYRVTHPWGYVAMKGLFGLSDDAWAGIVFYYCCLAAFLIELTGRPKKHRVALVVILAMTADLLGTVCIERDTSDPSLLVLVSYLVTFALVAAVGTILRWLGYGIRRLVRGPTIAIT